MPLVFDIGLIFCLGILDQDPSIYASHSSWDDRQAPPCPGFSVEVGSHEHFYFYLGWPGTGILLISISLIGGTEMKDCWDERFTTPCLTFGCDHPNLSLPHDWNDSHDHW
jgi:hypothetical protein